MGQGEGREWGKKGRGMSGFSPELTCQFMQPMSTHAQPMHLSDDAQVLLAREQILTVKS